MPSRISSFAAAAALALLPLSACGGDDSDPGSSTTGGSAGGGGSGGSGGGAARGCDAIELAPALVDAGAWDPGLTVAGFAGHDGLGPGVYDLARDADGALLAAGRFQYLGRDRVVSLARGDGDAQTRDWKADARLPFDLEQPGISAIAADAATGRVAFATYSTMPFPLEERDGAIYLSDGGGDFTLVGSFHGAVRTMTWFNGELWVGGVFALDSGEGAPGLSILGDQGWQAPPGGALTGLGVYELTADGTGILVGGAFSAIGGVAAQSVASFDGAAWAALDLPDATVYALARDAQGDLFAGGLFSVEGSVETGGIARWSGASWESVAGGLANPTFRGVVADLALYQGQLHVAGCFSSAGGVPASPGAVPAAGLARWTGQAWEALDDGASPVGTAWFSPLSCGDEGPAAAWDMERQRLLVDGDRLYLAGFFAGEGGVPSQSLIAYENGQWIAQGEQGRGFSGAARSLAVGGPDCAVHVMGGVTHAGDLAVDQRVLRDDGATWAPVGPPMPPEAYCWQLAVDAQGAPFLGCEYPPADGAEVPSGVVLRLAGDAWEPVGDPLSQGGVAAVAFDPTGALWAAGGAFEGFVARDEGGALVPLGAFNGRVGSIAFRPAAEGEPVQAVAGGYFTEVDGTPAAGVARWNGAAWEPVGAGVPGSVLAVAYAADGSIYASTADDGNSNRLILGRWDGASWTEVATPEPGPTPAGYAFYSLLARGDYVIAAGFAWPGSDERNLFVYDGSTFRSLRGGATAIYVESVALAQNGLWFGGTIAEAGPPAARLSSVGIAHLQAP